MRDDCLNPTLNKRARHFLRKRAIAERFKLEGYDDLHNKLSDCSEVSRAVVCIRCQSAFYIEDHCRQRTCPLCSYKESRKRGNFIERICQKMKHPKFITLTMPRWSKVPQDGIVYLRDRWNELRGHKLFAACRGGVYQIELKPKQNGWHIHLHAIVDAPFIPYQQLFTAWKTILRLPYVGVYIEAANTPQQRHYVAKYTAKSADFDGDLSTVVNWYLATKGQRLYSTFGDWYNIKESDLTDEPRPLEAEHICKFCGNPQALCSPERLRFTVEGDTLKRCVEALYELGPPKVPIW